MEQAARSTTVLCVEDHAIVREGLRLIIDLQPDMKVVGSASTGKEAIELFVKHEPDVTLLDLQLPDMSGVAVIEAIRHMEPDARIAVLTMYGGDDDIRRALKAGACAYLLKDVPADQLLQAIRQARTGKATIPPDVAARLAAASDSSTLTRREVQTIELIAKGLRNKEIGAALGISEVTVQVHVKNILSKLNVNDRTAAVNVAVHRGIIRLG